MGNQLNDQNGRRLEYNQAGQLVKVSQYNTTIAEYHYNAFNQRVMKQTQEGTTRFTYDLQGMMIQESTRSNKPAGQHNTRIVWLDNQPIQHVANNTHTAIISDHLNTPRIGLDQNANTTWHWLSDGFGHTEPANDPDGNGIATNIKLRFPGQYADKETGLYYNWHRYYDPATGRYVTSDPIGLMAGVNTYGYVGGNPLRYTDPFGLYFGQEVIEFIPNAIGADADFARNYIDMRAANTIGADKYFHCKANCEAAQRGLGGAAESHALSEIREIIDEYVKGDSPQDCDADRFANDVGRRGGTANPTGSCPTICSQFRPTSLAPIY